MVIFITRVICTSICARTKIVNVFTLHVESSELLELLPPNGVTLINVHVVFSFEKYNLIIRKH